MNDMTTIRLLERIANALDAMSPENQIGTMLKHLPAVLQEVERTVEGRMVDRRRKAARAAVSKRKTILRRRKSSKQS